MYSINSFALSRMNNGEFVGFFINLQKAMTESGTSTLGIDDALYTQYTDLLQKLTDQVYVTQGSEFTAQMQAADDKRDQIFKRLRYKLLAVQCAEQDSALNACKDIVETHILAKYTNDVTRLAYQEESAIITGFIYDLQTKLDDDARFALGILSDMDALDAANREFITAYNARVNERAVNGTGLTLQLRAKMGDVYTLICLKVQIAANDDSTDNAATALACQGFIDVLNVMILDAKRRIQQRTGNSADAAVDDGTGTTDPAAGGDTSADASSGSSDSSETSDSSSSSGSSSADPATTDPSTPADGGGSDSGVSDSGVISGDNATF